MKNKPFVKILKEISNLNKAILKTIKHSMWHGNKFEMLKPILIEYDKYWKEKSSTELDFIRKGITLLNQNLEINNTDIDDCEKKLHDLKEKFNIILVETKKIAIMK